MTKLLTRRTLVTAGVATVGASAIGAAARYNLIPPDYATPFGVGETLTYAAQRLLSSGYSRSREFTRDQISKSPVVNGPAPPDDAFRRLAADGFKDWRLQIEGLVDNPMSFSLADLQQLPEESHILLHACEQGWSYIAEWTGVRLSRVLELAKTRPQARYAVFIPFPNPQQTTGIIRLQWESIDMADALHPQTMLAYGMNGGVLPADFGAPLRLRMGREMGWKNTKYLSKIILTDDMNNYRKGAGTWFGGI